MPQKVFQYSDGVTTVQTRVSVGGSISELEAELQARFNIAKAGTEQLMTSIVPEPPEHIEVPVSPGHVEVPAL